MTYFICDFQFRFLSNITTIISIDSVWAILRLFIFSFGKTTTRVKIFWSLFIFDRTFISAQLKQNVIISNKHDIHELPHELPKDLRHRVLRNLRFQNFIELYPSVQPSSQNENLVNTSKKPSCPISHGN